MDDLYKLPPMNVDLRLVETQELIEEIKRRHLVSVVLTCQLEDGKAGQEVKVFDFSGGLTLAYGLADLFVRRSRAQLITGMAYIPGTPDADRPDVGDEHPGEDGEE